MPTGSVALFFGKMSAKHISHDDIVHLFGDIDDHRVSQILAMDVSREQLEEVAMWLAKQSAVMGKLHKPLTGVASEIYEILIDNEEFAEDADRG